MNCVGCDTDNDIVIVAVIFEDHVDDNNLIVDTPVCRACIAEWNEEIDAGIEYDTGDSR